MTVAMSYSLDDYVQACAPVTDSSPANSLNTAMQIIFTTVCCTTGVWAIYKIWKVRQLMSVRQRAPLIAIVHILITLLYTVLQIGMNIGLYSGAFDAWAMVDTLGGVSIGRYLYKFCRLLLRIGFGFLGWFRALVIWCQWQKPSKVPGIIGSIVGLLATRKSMWKVLAVTILLLTLLFHGPGWYVENSPTVGTWFVPKFQIMYKMFNSTTYRILENLILLHLWWLTRNFPRLMSIQDEMRIICSFCILCNEIFELDYPSEMFIGLKINQNQCKTVMNSIVSLSMALYAEPQTTKIPTLAELHHVYYFIGRRKYRHYFCRYLSTTHEPSNAKHLLSLVKQFSNPPNPDITVISNAPTFGAPRNG